MKLREGDTVLIIPSARLSGVPERAIGQLGTLSFHNMNETIIVKMLDPQYGQQWVMHIDDVASEKFSFGHTVHPEGLPEDEYITIGDEDKRGYVHILAKSGKDYIVLANTLTYKERNDRA